MRESKGKILIVGYGSVGRRHTRNLQQLGCRDFVFLRSGRPDVIDDVPPPGESFFSLSEAMDQNLSAAVIATPSALHLGAALPLAENGCHLFIEKPLATDRDIESCEKLVSIAREHNLVTMIGCQFRFHPLLRELRDGLRNNRLGKIAEARAEWGEYLPDWHPWEDYRDGYAARAGLGGGVLLTLIHPVDYLYWLFDAVVDVQAVCRKAPELQTSVPDDWAELTLHFQNGVVGQVHLDFVQNPAVHQLSIRGQRGEASLDFHLGELVWTVGDQLAEKVNVGPEFTRNDMFVSEMKHFLDAVAKNQATEIPVEDGLVGLQIVAAARQAAQSRTSREADESKQSDPDASS